MSAQLQKRADTMTDRAAAIAQIRQFIERLGAWPPSNIERERVLEALEVLKVDHEA